MSQKGQERELQMYVLLSEVLAQVLGTGEGLTRKLRERFPKVSRLLTPRASCQPFSR